MSQQKEVDVPVVSADRNLAELTIKALILGALLSMVLAAANAYIGLLVGLTVSASIPAAADAGYEKAIEVLSGVQ